LILTCGWSLTWGRLGDMTSSRERGRGCERGEGAQKSGGAPDRGVWASERTGVELTGDVHNANEPAGRSHSSEDPEADNTAETVRCPSLVVPRHLGVKGRARCGAQATRL
jgi:hypothetical protein